MPPTRGQGQGGVGALRVVAGGLRQHRAHLLGADLVELVHRAQDRGHARVVGAQPAVEALDQAAVVHPHPRARQGQRGHGLGHHHGHLHVVVGGEDLAVDHVDVGLDELAVPALLGALPAPDLLHLVAAQREGQVRGVLGDVAGEGHRQVVVQRQGAALASAPGSSGPAALGTLGTRLPAQALQDVHLVVDLALGQQHVQRLDGAGLDPGEAVQLEGRAQRGGHGGLDRALVGQHLGEPRDRGRQRGPHGASASR